jgi:hypothetical protein
VGCFPRLYADCVESLGFHSHVSALGLSSFFFALVAKRTTSVKVNIVCIDTLSWIAPAALLSPCDSFGWTIDKSHRDTLGLCELLVVTLDIAGIDAA